MLLTRKGSYGPLRGGAPRAMERLLLLSMRQAVSSHEGVLSQMEWVRVTLLWMHNHHFFIPFDCT